MGLDFNFTKINYPLLEKSKLTFQKNSRIKPIYHYTSIGGLYGILSSKTLRFTNIKYMNDKDEIVAGLDSVAKSCNASEDERENLRNAFLNHGTQSFVCCFSTEDDSLPMWNYYTKEVNNQGCNIQFDDKKLVESILRQNPELDGCDFSFGIVDYSKDNESEYSNIITNEILSSAKLAYSKVFVAMSKSATAKRITEVNQSSLKDWENKIEEAEKTQKLYDLPIFFYNGEKCSFEKNSAGNYLFFVKRDCFRQEKEFRIVVTAPDELLHQLRQKGKYKFRVSNGVLVPYLELKFNTDDVKGITISPTLQSDLVEISAKEFLEFCEFKDINSSEFIKRSKVPVRF